MSLETLLIPTKPGSRKEGPATGSLEDLMICCCYAGWICETHPERPWPHDECPGPQMRCSNVGCMWWRGPKHAALDTSDWIAVVSSERRTIQ
jgi:hypothetical protein